MLGAGARYALSLLAGRARPLTDRRGFAAAVARGLRPHFFVFSAGAALAGASAEPAPAEPWRVAVAAAAAGLGWGAGQLVNDLLDVDADAVDAPDRPAVRGLLPLGPTAAVALAIALVVTLATLAVHPHAALLAAVSALLMAVYGAAKRLPLLGNLAHGALMATAATIGLAAAAPHTGLAELFGAGATRGAYVGLVAALYLQSNYEKDRAGDALAGYRTLAHVLGVRGSAALRALGALAVTGLAVRWQLVDGWPAAALLALATLLMVASTLPSLRSASDGAALSGYRFAVHATLLFLLVPVLRVSALLVALLAAAGALLVEHAFRRSPNP